MKRPEILDAAKACVCGDREQDYGTPENNFGLIAEFWNTYLEKRQGERLTGKDVAVMMTLLKISRITVGQVKDDNFVDACGYMACCGELSENTNAGA